MIMRRPSSRTPTRGNQAEGTPNAQVTVAEVKEPAKRLSDHTAPDPLLCWCRWRTRSPAGLGPATGLVPPAGAQRTGPRLNARGSGVPRDFVGLQVQCRESRRRNVLVPDAGRSCPGGDCIHLLAGLPQRDDDELAGLGVGEQVIAFEPGLLAGAGQLLLEKADSAVESPGPGLGCDHAREHRSPSALRSGDYVQHTLIEQP